MKNLTRIFIGTALLFGLGETHSLAKGVGTSAGTILVKSPNARASGLGEAFSAVTNDIVGLGYNPASIQTIQQRQASLQFQRGIADDFFSQAMFGLPTRLGIWGFSVGYYDGGQFELFDGNSARDVTIRSDLTASAAYANKLGDFSFGLTGKFLRSELAETFSASAGAVDLGVQYAIGSRLTLGSAIQNLGTQLKYQNQDEDLPLLYRAGLSWAVKPKQITLFLDGSYLSNEEMFRPSVGLETFIGPLALRAGFQGGEDREEFSLGTGFNYRDSWLDYSFGMIQDFETQHQISYSFRFGSVMAAPAFVKQELPTLPTPQIVRDPEQNEEIPSYEKPAKKRRLGRAYTLAQTLGEKSLLKKMADKLFNWFGNEKDEFRLKPKKHRRVKEIKKRPTVYVIEPKDTLKKIAIKFYGDAKYWRNIYERNKTALRDFKRDFRVGKGLILP